MSRSDRKAKRLARNQARMNGTFKQKGKLPLLEKTWPSFYDCLRELSEEYNLPLEAIKKVSRHCKRMLRHLIVQEIRSSSGTQDIQSFWNQNCRAIRNVFLFAESKMALLSR